VTDIRFPTEDYYAASLPPHIIPGHPFVWYYVDSLISDGEVAMTLSVEFPIEATSISITSLDDAGNDQHALLAALGQTPFTDGLQITWGQGESMVLGIESAVDNGTSVTYTVEAVPGGSRPPFADDGTVAMHITPISVAADDEPEPDADPIDVELLECVTVQTGDTLWSYAQAWGTTVEAIAEWNGITDVDHIEVGDTVCPPGIEPEP
jgi:hypothetical protein